MGSSPDNAGTAGTARRCGSGKRDEKVYARNQWSKLLKRRTSSNLVDTGRDAVRDHRLVGGQLRSRRSAVGGEATVKDCGVAVAMLPG